MKLISLSGQLYNGKDEFADYLCSKLNWEKASFASNVKRIFCETFNVDLNFIEEWKRKKECPPGFDMNVRDSLIFIGSGFRKIRHNIWIDLLLKNNKKDLCISDCRYINEVRTVKKYDGVSILLWRPGHENDLDNDSEQEIMPFVKSLQNEDDGIIKNGLFDIWIKNDGSLFDLYNKIDEIVIPYVLKKWQ